MQNVRAGILHLPIFIFQFSFFIRRFRSLAVRAGATAVGALQELQPAAALCGP